jgi:hypothetical protein
MHIVRIDGPSSTINHGTSKLRGGLPNDLGEVRVLGILGVIILRFIRPQGDPIGDGERTSSHSQVLCKT